MIADKTRPSRSPQETPNGPEVAKTAELEKRVEKPDGTKTRNPQTPSFKDLTTGRPRSFRILRRKNRQFGSFASLRNASIPRSIVSTLAAYERRKHSSRRLKTFPGMISVLYFEIAFSTNSVPVPQGVFGNM